MFESVLIEWSAVSLRSGVSKGEAERIYKSKEFKLWFESSYYKRMIDEMGIGSRTVKSEYVGFAILQYKNDVVLYGSPKTLSEEVIDTAVKKTFDNLSEQRARGFTNVTVGETIMLGASGIKETIPPTSPKTMGITAIIGIIVLALVFLIAIGYSGLGGILVTEHGRKRG